MDRPRILVTRRLSIDVAAFLRERLGPCEVDIHDEETAMPRSALLERVATSDALVATLNDRVDAELLARAPRLQVVGNHAVGVDNIDLAACKARGVRVCNTPDVLTDATADLAFALLLAAARRLREGDKLVREGRFRGWAPTMLLGLELRSAQLGIFGFGRIGQAVARRALGFGMRIAFVRRSSAPPADAGVAAAARAVSFEELLETSDAVSLHAPLTPQTRHAFGAPQLARMKRGALLINTARGPLVDEAALASALESGHLGGAALDVYEREPLVEPRLPACENVILLPHLGSSTTAARRQMAELAAGDAARVLRGEKPLNPVV